MADIVVPRAGASARVFRSLAEHDRADAEYWAALPADVRVMQVWKLSLEQWQLQGGDAYEPGFSRFVASVRRP